MALTAQKIDQHEQLAKDGIGIRLACKAVGMSTSTYAAWAKKGETAQKGTLEREFYDRVVTVRQAKGKAKPSRTVSEVPETGLSQDMLVAMLEEHAVNGDREAVKLLLTRPWEKKEQPKAQTPAIFGELVSREG